MNCEAQSAKALSRSVTSAVASFVSEPYEFTSADVIPASFLKQTFLIKLPMIIFDSATFHLKKSVELVLFHENGVWHCESPDLTIRSFGDTTDQAAYSFCEDFSVFWEEIAQAPDRSLASNARRIKKALKALVRSVEHKACL